jgi:heme o synthase
MSSAPPTGAVPAVAAPVGLAASARRTGALGVLGDYLELTKPKVQSLLLLSTIATMYVAGDPSLGLVALTCLGGYLSAGGAGAVNHWFDRDIDARMKRTATRPISRSVARSPRCRCSSSR